MIKVYYFDGSAGCERCQASTGYTFDPPGRPHPNCNCPIIEEDAVLDDFEIVLRNLLMLEDHIVTSETFSWEEHDFNRIQLLELDEDEVHDLSPQLEELARSEGWSPPESEVGDLQFGVPSFYTAEVNVWYERYTVDMFAELTAIGTIGDDTFHVVLEYVSGHYAINVRVTNTEINVREWPY